MWHVYYRQRNGFGWEIHSRWSKEEEALDVVKALIAQGYDTKIVHL